MNNVKNTPSSERNQGGFSGTPLFSVVTDSLASELAQIAIDARKAAEASAESRRLGFLAARLANRVYGRLTDLTGERHVQSIGVLESLAGDTMDKLFDGAVYGGHESAETLARRLRGVAQLAGAQATAASKWL